jgi:hypothetical protein
MAIRRLGRRTAVLVPVIAFAVGGLVAPAQATTTTVTFGSTAAEQMFTVPSHVGTIHVVAIGAAGETAISGSGVAGLGARVSGAISVHGGERLYIEVGGTASSQAVGGFNGGGAGGQEGSFDDSPAGGGGGGASDVRTRGAADGVASLRSRLIVAGGGGGASTDQSGGAAGQPGIAACLGPQDCASGGGAGTTTGGGAAGTGDPSGTAGELGVGGKGADDYYTTPYTGAGGGGGGLYGGGGGGELSPGGASGGGGSSGFAHSVRSPTVDADTTGVALVTLTYSKPIVTATSVTVSRHRRSLSVKGTVKPAAAGIRVTVTLLRKSGSKYKKVATKRPLQSAAGHFSTTFSRAKAGKCEIKATFAKYRTFTASHVTRKLAC